MKLSIHDSLFVEDLQDRFAECFPGLKIEFYKSPHHWKEGSAKEKLIDPKTRLEDIRKNHNTGVMEIKSSYTTGKVEQDLKHIYGLNAQIFRKEKNSWVQTVSTDTCTLKEQMELVQQQAEPKTEPSQDDYDFL